MKGLSVIQVPVGGFDRNFSYVVADRERREALVVDPCGDFEKVASLIAAHALQVCGIAVTHTHFDHIARLEDACARYRGAPVYAHASVRVPFSVPLVPLEEGDTLPVGGGRVRVWHTPGHHPTSLCYLIEGEEAEDGVPKIITGDTLLVGGCGRTDAAGAPDLYRSLQRLKTLPDDTVVYPGHDYGVRPVSTIRDERRENPYLVAECYEAFARRRLQK